MMSELTASLSITLPPVAMAVLLMILLLRSRKHARQHLQNQLQQLRLLRQLLEQFQRHRGLSTGLLNGDDSLQGELTETRRRLADSEQQALAQLPVLPHRWQALLQQWQRVAQEAGSNPEQNLNNHHRLIRNTLFLFEDIACDMDLVQLSAAEQQALRVLWREIPQTAEWIGQARALGTGIAARKCSNAEQRMRLRFLHQKISQQSSVAFNVLNQGADSELQQSVVAFLSCLEQELLAADEPVIDAMQYFQMATATINQLLGLLDASLEQLQQTQRLS